MSAAKVMILTPGSHLHPAPDNHQRLLVILRGAVHMASTDPSTSQVSPVSQKSLHQPGTNGQAQPQTGQFHAEETPFSSGSSSCGHVLDKDIPDARGSSFGLPGLLQGTALDVHVTAESVVEAYSIPWSLIQVGFLLS